jgi:hypothetical protein
MLVAWYMAFRYRLDFQPLLLLLAILGAAVLAQRSGGWQPAGQRRLAWLVWTLLALQITSAHLHAVIYMVSGYGPAHDALGDGLILSYARALGLR